MISSQVFGLNSWLLFTKMEKSRWGADLGGEIKSSVVSSWGQRWPLAVKVELSGRRLDVRMGTPKERIWIAGLESHGAYRW